ncbi:MAG TPA: cytochrome c oxidase subunit 3 [Thermoanaerobaculia bacterium]|jgi:heme/copper-type cytochrome/quinol oxidase subunit 3|nr:cytochrome c oxidase subunit 3 [Thermoanaerobaculia bacterium]
MEPRRTFLDVAALPKHAFGSRDLLWWGNAGFMAIEGTMFAMLLATLFYLRSVGGEWPPSPWMPPDLLWGTLNTAVMLASIWPSKKAEKAAHALDAHAMRYWMVIADLFGVLFLVLRGFELAHLNVRWDSNAYGSIVWLVLGFHTTHLATDAVESWVLTRELFKKTDARRFVDVAEDCGYWDFVVLVWVPLYVVVYLLPRWS